MWGMTVGTGGGLVEEGKGVKNWDNCIRINRKIEKGKNKNNQKIFKVTRHPKNR